MIRNLSSLAIVLVAFVDCSRAAPAPTDTSLTSTVTATFGAYLSQPLAVKQQYFTQIGAMRFSDMATILNRGADPSHLPWPSAVVGAWQQRFATVGDAWTAMGMNPLTFTAQTLSDDLAVGNGAQAAPQSTKSPVSLALDGQRYPVRSPICDQQHVKWCARLGVSLAAMGAAINAAITNDFDNKNFPTVSKRAPVNNRVNVQQVDGNPLEFGYGLSFMAGSDIYIDRCWPEIGTTPGVSTSTDTGAAAADQ